MASKILLEPLQSGDQTEFLAAVAASKQLHRPWVNPPASPELFQAFAQRMQGPVNHGFLVRMAKTRQLVGFIDVTNIVRCHVDDLIARVPCAVGWCGSSNVNFISVDA